jgi:hypothetical protein
LLLDSFKVVARKKIVSAQLSIEFCNGGCEEAVDRERLLKTPQAGKRLSGCCGNW